MYDRDMAARAFNRTQVPEADWEEINRRLSELHRYVRESVGDERKVSADEHPWAVAAIERDERTRRNQ